MTVDVAELADLDPFTLLDVEQDRLDRHLAGLDEAGWQRPTRCAGWTCREMVAHLAGGEDYNLATLEDGVGTLFEEASRHGVKDVTTFNDWSVRRRADRSAADVLAEWRVSAARVRAGLRERGDDGVLSTMVGPYPARLQAFHLAFEAAVHADDMQAVVAPEEREGRTRWMARWGRFAVAEGDRAATIAAAGEGRWTVTAADETVEMDDATLADAVAGRLGDGRVPAGVVAVLNVTP